MGTIPASFTRDIVKGAVTLTYRNSLKILRILSQSKHNDTRVYEAVKDRLTCSISHHCRDNPVDIENVVIGLSKLEKSIARSSLMSIMVNLSQRDDLDEVIRAVSPHSLTNILNCLSKTQDKCSVPFRRISKNISKYLLSKMTTNCDGFDDRIVSLLVRSIVVSNLDINPSFLRNQIEQWAKLSLASKWTPQSYGLFAYYMSQMNIAIGPQNSPSIISILQQPLSDSLQNFSDQNICNYAVGYCRIVRQLPNYLESEIRGRSLSSNDLFFLLKSPLLINTSLSCLEAVKDLQWRDVLVITDILTKNCGSQDLLLTKYGTQLTRLVDSIIEKDGLENGFKNGRVLFVMGRLNYIPATFEAPNMEYAFDAKTSCAILSTITKLGISGMVGERFLNQRVSDVVSNGTVSECALSVLSCCSMTSFEQAHKLLNRIMRDWNYDSLNVMDRSQILKGVAMLSLEGECRIVERVLDWIGPNNWNESIRPLPSNTSRSHKEVVGILQKTHRTFRIESEVFVPNISSFIDIQLIADK